RLGRRGPPQEQIRQIQIPEFLLLPQQPRPQHGRRREQPLQPPQGRVIRTLKPRRPRRLRCRNGRPEAPLGRQELPRERPALRTLQKVKKDVVILRLQVREERTGPLLLIGMLRHSSSLVRTGPNSCMDGGFESMTIRINSNPSISNQYTRNRVRAS